MNNSDIKGRKLIIIYYLRTANSTAEVAGTADKVLSIIYSSRSEDFTAATGIPLYEGAVNL